MSSDTRTGPPPGRYGRTSTRRTRLVLGAVVVALVLALVGWFAWAAYESRSSATGTDVGFHVVDDATVQVTFDVTKPRHASATCVVQALDSGFAVVGTVRVSVGPSSHDVVRRTATVRTANRATTGQVASCSVDG
jgi:hypothetical protein